LAGTAGAALVNIQLDTFEGCESNHIDTATNEPLTNWDDVTNGYKPGTGSPDNCRADQAGNGSAKGVRVRSSTGAMVLENALQLVTLNAAKLVISFDIKEHTVGYESWLDYSAAGDFSDTVNLDYWDGSGPIDTWVAKSYDLLDGVGGIVFTDTAQFRIGKQSRGGGSNPTFHVYDNISIDYEPIPEPATMSLLVLGGLSVLARRRRRA